MTAIVSQYGELLCTLNADEETITLNTPQGCLAVDEPPSTSMYYQDGSWHDMPHAPSQNCTFDYVSKTWKDTRSLDGAKTQKWFEIKSQRDTLELGGFIYAGLSYDSDQVSQGRIVAAASLGVGVEWTLKDNTTVWLSSEQLKELQTVLAAHVTDIHIRGRNARIAIESATTISDVESIVF